MKPSAFPVLKNGWAACGQWLWVEGGGGDGNAVMSTAEEQEHLAAWETFELHPMGDTQMTFLSSDGAWCVGLDDRSS